MKLFTIRRNLPAVVLGLLSAFILYIGIVASVGCQSSYWDRNNTEAVKKAEARAEQAEKALAVISGQKANVDTALTLAQAGLEAAKAAKLDAEKIAAAEKAVAFAADNKARVFETAAAVEKAIKEARAEADKAKASGGQSAAEQDAAVVGNVLGAIGSMFGPVGAVGGAGLAGILGLIARSKSKQVTEANAKVAAAKDVVWALEAVKDSPAGGGEGKIDFNDPAVKKALDNLMGANGKRFVDEVQRG